MLFQYTLLNKIKNVPLFLLLHGITYQHENQGCSEIFVWVGSFLEKKVDQAHPVCEACELNLRGIPREISENGCSKVWIGNFSATK